VDEQAPTDPLTGKQLGPYRVSRRLGFGGFGAVYEATHVRTGRRYALKVVRPDRALVSANARERFRREAEALGGIGHAGIVAIHDYGSCDGVDYLVMDLLEGEDLAQRLQRRGRLGFEETLRLVASVADALNAAHRAGIVHRDLKPGNVFLARKAGEQEQPVLLDFGLAKDLDGGAESLTASGEALGTPAYMAPEQASAGDIDARTDVYALGALTYHMLTGSPPFTGESAASVLLKVVSEPPPPLPPELDLPAHVGEALRRAMAKDPASRFADTLAFRDSLLGRVPAFPPTRPVRAIPAGKAAGAKQDASQRPDRPVQAARSSPPVARTLPVGLALVAFTAVVGGSLALYHAAPWVNARAQGSVGRTMRGPERTSHRTPTDGTDGTDGTPTDGTDGTPADGTPTDGASMRVEVARAVVPSPPPEEPVSPRREASPMRERSRPGPRSRLGAPPVHLPGPPADEPVPVSAPVERSTPPGDAEHEAEQRAELEELQRLLRRVERLRRELGRLERGREPSFCPRSGATRRGERTVVAVSVAQNLDRLMERACEPFARVRTLTPELRGLVLQIEQRLDRAEDRVRASVPTNQPRSVADEVEAAVVRARRVVEGVADGQRQFNCAAPVWAELRRLATTNNPWAAQAALDVTRPVSRLCGRLADRAELRRLAQRMRDALDDDEGLLRAMLLPLRASLGGP